MAGQVQVEVPPLAPRDLADASTREVSTVVAARVVEARRRIAGGTDLPLIPSGKRLLHEAVRRLALSARAHEAIVRVARTIAHLEGSGSIGPVHVAEAVQYRTLDRRVPAPSTLRDKC